MDWSLVLAFIAVMNPFALFLYLEPLMDDLKHKEFVYVWLKACTISFLIFIAFAYTGLIIFEDIFQISFESFRIFGGFVVASFAFIYIIRGDKAMISLRGDLDDLASQLALPFIVGAATITLAILIGVSARPLLATAGITIVIAVTFLSVLLMKFIRDKIARKRFKTAFDKNVQIFLRLNAFIVGAIGVDMIVTGIKSVASG